MFEDGESVFMFTRPNQKELRKVSTRLNWKISKFTPKVVKNILQYNGFTLVKRGKHWLGYWGKHYNIRRFQRVQTWQKVNHFPMAFEIGRKDKLFLNFQKMRSKYGEKEYDYHPESFVLPLHGHRLKDSFSSHKLWIVKPHAAARGNGIKLASRWDQICVKKDVIVSRYISRPYLIHGKKFDMRVYVLVTSYDPLRVYIYKNGVARFASETYSMKSSDFKKQVCTSYQLFNQSKK